VRRRAGEPRQAAERETDHAGVAARGRMLGPHARTSGSACWWYQMLTRGRPVRITARAARVSGSENGREPECSRSPGRPIGRPPGRKVAVEVHAVGVETRASRAAVRVEVGQDAHVAVHRRTACRAARTRRAIAVPAHSVPWMQPTTSTRRCDAGLPDTVNRSGRPPALRPTRPPATSRGPPPCTSPASVGAGRSPPTRRSPASRRPAVALPSRDAAAGSSTQVPIGTTRGGTDQVRTRARRRSRFVSARIPHATTAPRELVGLLANAVARSGRRAAALRSSWMRPGVGSRPAASGNRTRLGIPRSG
jgi:hypothetical protein